MNILNLTSVIPYPLDEGGKVSQFALLDYLRQTHNITLVLVAYSAKDLGYIADLRNIWPNVTIKIIDFTNKTVPSLVERVKKSARELFGNPNYTGPKYSSEFDNPGKTNMPGSKNRELINQLQHIFEIQRFDIIQIDHIEFMNLIHSLPLNSKKIFVHHEIIFGRLQSGIPNGEISPYEKYILNYLKQTEGDLLKQYDAVFVFSEIDRKKLSEIGIKNVYSSPFPVLAENFVTISKGVSAIEKLVFLGGEDHIPNEDAIKWYVNEIAPKIRLFSDLKLYVIGKWSESSIKNFADDPSISFAGYVEDLVSYCTNSVMLVPIRIGSGIRTKILYAMAQGIPVISTSIGCEGIPLDNNKSVLIANSSIEFSVQIQKVLNNLELCDKLRTEANIIAKNIYSQKATANLRTQLYKKVLNN